MPPKPLAPALHNRVFARWFVGSVGVLLWCSVCVVACLGRASAVHCAWPVLPLCLVVGLCLWLLLACGLCATGRLWPLCVAVLALAVGAPAMRKLVRPAVALVVRKVCRCTARCTACASCQCTVLTMACQAGRACPVVR